MKKPTAEQAAHTLEDDFAHFLAYSGLTEASEEEKAKYRRGFVAAWRPLERSPEPVLWIEAEESARGKTAKEVVGGMLYLTRLYTTEPDTSNPVWKLCELP